MIVIDFCDCVVTKLLIELEEALKCIILRSNKPEQFIICTIESLAQKGGITQNSNNIKKND